MKIYRLIFLSVIVVLSVSLVVLSCKKDNNSAKNQNAVFLAPVANGSIVAMKTLLFSTTPYKFEFSAALLNATNVDVKVNVAIDSSMVAYFNSMENKNYRVLPAGSYSLDSSTMTITANSKASASNHVSVNTSLLQFDKQYLLPIKVSSVSSAQIANNQALSAKYFVIAVPTPVIGNLSDKKKSYWKDPNNSWNPQRGNDGNTDGNWANGSVCESGSGTEQYWEVDLGAISPRIDTIRVWNRTDCCWDRTTNFYVFVSDVPFSGTTVAASLAQAGVHNFYTPGNAGRPTTILPGVSGRYIRLQNTGGTSLTLAELTAIGIKP